MANVLGINRLILAGGLGLLVLIVMAVEIAYRSRILVDLLIVVIRHAKRELKCWADTWRRLKHELTTWRGDDDGEP